jgi:RNA polymerase sigma-70 factor (ECF subfamily)
MRLPRSPGREPSDTELVYRARNHDRRAFENLIKRYEAPLRKRLFALMRSESLAEDLAQDICVKAWLHLHSLVNPAAFHRWLLAIAENTAKEWWSKRDAIRDAAVLDVDDVAATSTDDTPYSALRRRALRERLRREIRALPADSAEALILHYEDGLSCHEIASQLQVSIEVVHKRLSRGRKRLERRIARIKGELAVLGATGAPRQSSEAFVAAVMRALRRASPPAARPDQALPAAVVAASRLRAGWRALVPVAVVAAVFALAAEAVLQAARTADQILVGLPGEPAPTSDRSTAPAPSAAGPSAPRLPHAAPVNARWQAPGVPENDEVADYVVRSESTQIESALFGAHDLRPMDAYGEKLYEMVSKQFVMYLASCLRSDVVGAEDRSRIDLDLRFSLWRDPARGPQYFRLRRAGDDDEVRYRITGHELSKIQQLLFELCLERSFGATPFPAPDDDAPRVVAHHIAVDFGVMQQSLEAMFASVQ